MGILGLPLGYLMYWIFNVVKNYGIALILFVIVTKLILLPLSIKQQKNTSRMAAFQPKLKALEKKCGKDKQKYQQEMMKLYEQEGMNPAAGCAPMLIQFALLFGIIDVIYKPLKHILRINVDLIQKATEVIGKHARSAEIQIISEIQKGTNQKIINIFSADDITRINGFDMNFFGLNIGEVPTWGFNWYVLIPILSGITALLMTIVTTRQQVKNGQELKGGMKYLMYFSPIMSVWIAFTLPCGVGLYWIISNVIQIIITLVLGKIYTPEKLSLVSDKDKDKAREKMRKKREKLEAYSKIREEKAPVKTIEKNKSDEEDGESYSSLSEKEIAKKRLADARKRMAEKYGDEYKE